MRYADFRKMVLTLPIIQAKDILFFENKRQPIRNQLSRWQEKGLIIKLKRGIYIFNENDRKINPSKPYIANQLYAPSYVSLEYALGMYGLIPERVRDITSVTTRKTKCLKSAIGTFTYQSIKPEAFSGFKSTKDDAGLSFFVALPEKAVVDFLYLNIRAFKPSDIDVFSASYRFQNVESLHRAEVMRMAALFGNVRLMDAAKMFCDFITREKKT